MDIQALKWVPTFDESTDAIFSKDVIRRRNTDAIFLERCHPTEKHGCHLF
ncbi:MAG: hypothetical protein NT175_11410 [Bacteroidetes bacterium]|nr:hypothetical protein [Bacteroidota bacterium]